MKDTQFVCNVTKIDKQNKQITINLPLSLKEKEIQMLKKIIPLLLLLLPGCVQVPEGVSPVAGFDINRYLGKWHEIARLDHSFERGLENVSAVYTLRDDGGINVINRGYDPDKKEWKQAKGKAYFVGDSTVGQLKVSFFGPFYGGYNIIDLDTKEYSYSVVCGPDKSYLWVLARAPEMNASLLSKIVAQAKLLDFDTEALIYVNHEPIQD
jgi:apolipoprotein D and lipocalin family protein